MIYNNEDVILSIIVVTYNHEKYIAKTIESLINQNTKYKYEILIGDDSSKDNTQSIISKYRDKYSDIITAVLREKNVGATYNGYDLLKKAKGKYIANCDGDDYWSDTERIERDIDFLEGNPQYSGICSRCNIVDENNNLIKQDNIYERAKFWRFGKDVYTIKDFEQWEMPGHISAFTYKNFLKEDLHDYSICYNAHSTVGDRTVVLLSVLHGSIKCLDNKVSCYRFRINSNSENFMSAFADKNMRDDDYLMLKKFEEYSREEFKYPLNLRNIKLDRFVGSVSVYLKNPTKRNKEVVKNIINYSGEKTLYKFYYLKIFLIKKIYWNILKKDKRIVL